MSANQSPAQNLLQIWKNLSSYPGGKQLFSLLLKWRIPYSGSIGATVMSMQPGHARLRLRDKRSIRNHLNSIHAIALTNLGELTSGLALNMGLPCDARGIVLDISTEYFKKARGTLIADSQCIIPTIKGEMDYYVEADIRDEQHDKVASVRVKWRLKSMAAL